MAGIRIEEERVTRRHHVGTVSVKVFHLSGQHVDKLHPGMLEQRKYFRLVIKRDEVGFHCDGFSDAVAKKLIFMACAWRSEEMTISDDLP